MSLRTTQVFCNWEDPEKLPSITSLGFYLITDKPSYFSLTTSESTTSAEEIWKLWEDAVEQQNSDFIINGAQWAQGEKEWSESCNLISIKAIWLQNLPIYEQKSAHKLNSENIERFNEKILRNYKIEQVYVNPKSPLGCLLIKSGLVFDKGQESEEPQLDFESEAFITTLGKLNDIVSKTIPQEKVSDEKEYTVYTSKKSLWGRVSSSSAGRLLTAVANKILHPGRNVKNFAYAVTIISLCAILFRHSPRKMTHF